MADFFPDNLFTQDPQQWEAYLQRVGLDSAPAPDEEGLHILHRAQFSSLPFENLDIQLGRAISLQPQDLVEKMVHHRRGGYCFELNGLMLMVLQKVGFDARPLLARVHLGGRIQGRTHQVNLVALGGRRWIMDVGFGAGGLRCPLPLEAGHLVEGQGWAFRLVQREPWGTMMQSREDGQWKDSYSFGTGHVIPADIAVANHYTSTSRDSHFTTGRTASRPLPDGRISLRDFTLTTIRGEQKTTRNVPPGPAYLEVLETELGISLEVGYTDLLPLAGPDRD